MNKYTPNEIRKTSEALITGARKIFGTVELLDSWFAVSDLKEFDLIVTIQFMEPDGTISEMSRYITK